MSSNEEKRLPSFMRSKESLKLAVEFLGKDPDEQAAERVVEAAALFDAYLSGRICFSVHDCTSLFHGFSNMLRASIEVRSVSGVNNDPTVPVGSSNFRQSQGLSDSPDQVFFGHTGHSSSPTSVSKDARTDSTSGAGNESVTEEIGNHAPALKGFVRTLSSHELEQVVRHTPPAWVINIIKVVAREEIKRRCGEGESVHVKERG